MIECGILNRLRGTGVVKHFGTIRVDEIKIWKITVPKIEVEVKLVWNHVYGLYLALVFGLLAMNVWAGLAVLVAYLVGESKGWGEWVGSLTRHEPWTEELLAHCYRDNEGKTFPYIHQVANSIVKEQCEGSFEKRANQYKRYATLALMLRGIYWWLPVYLVIAAFGVISWQVAVVAGIGLGIAFPLACAIGREIEFTRVYDLKFIKLSFSRGWENQEVVYGMIQGVVLWSVVLGVIYG
ncbi:MAG: hypothetical protein ACMV1B_09115 [Prevotella sp.]